MASDNQDSTSREFAQIKPAAIKLSQAAPAVESTRPPVRRTVAPVAWAGLVLLVSVALLVIFVLPERVRVPATPPDPGAATPAAPAQQAAHPSAAAPSGTTAGPFDEAQQAKLRKESQDILAELLEAHEALQKMGAARWAQADFAAAVKLAESGDAAYRQRDFTQARSLYEQALMAFQELLNRSDRIFAEALERGRNALSAGKAAAATEAFQAALTIRPDDADAGKGMQRAGTLDEVFALIARGDELLKQDRLEEARESYQGALDLDPETETAKRQLDRVAEIGAARRFTAAMSKGYAAVETGDLEAAARFFKEAVTMKPGAPEARSALGQTEQKLTTARIGRLLQEAGELEQAEQWQDALQRYDAALALDRNLLAAQEGKQHASRRADLDGRLRAAIARPDRLADPSVNAETEALLRAAVSISPPGPTLKKQIAVLGGLLEQSIIPVSVLLQSNNSTNVTVYKVGNLGQFESRELSLRPGRYVAIGSRPGYRDVRVEFVVEAGKPSAPVIIQCEEKIALGN